MSSGDDRSSSSAGDRPSGGEPSTPRVCPYCGARALRPVEETRETGGAEETLSVCSACGRSLVSPRWTVASTRRVLLRVLWSLGPYFLIAAAAYFLYPRFPWLPNHTFGRPGGTGGAGGT